MPTPESYKEVQRVTLEQCPGIAQLLSEMLADTVSQSLYFGSRTREWGNPEIMRAHD
jgi:hypothetical protein